MPLHLLGKKSWNVYNQDNIDRVRRDEAEAIVAEQETERKKRDEDAAERLRLLRGGSPRTEDSAHPAQHDHKRKREHDDTSVQSHRDEKRLRHLRTREDARNVSRHDSRGESRANVTQEPLDKISNMRFRDAAGRQPDAQRPWYSAATLDHEASEIGRDVWGNEDAGRHTRNQKRLDASDPLLAIKKGVKQLKDVEKQKSEWRKEREKDLYEVEDLARKERHRRRKEEKRRHKSEEYRSRTVEHRSHRSSHDRQQDHEGDRSKHRRGERI